MDQLFTQTDSRYQRRLHITTEVIVKLNTLTGSNQYTIDNSMRNWWVNPLKWSQCMRLTDQGFASFKILLPLWQFEERIQMHSVNKLLTRASTYIECAYHIEYGIKTITLSLFDSKQAMIYKLSGSIMNFLQL